MGSTKCIIKVADIRNAGNADNAGNAGNAGNAVGWWVKDSAFGLLGVG